MMVRKQSRSTAATSTLSPATTVFPMLYQHTRQERRKEEATFARVKEERLGAGETDEVFGFDWLLIGYSKLYLCKL